MGKAQKSRSKKDRDDDTPRSFQRLMSWQARLNAPKPEKKTIPRQAKASPDSKEASDKPVAKALQRKRGESMADFSRRVDEALPLPRAKGIESRKTARNAKKHKTKAENLRAEYKQRLDAKRRRIEDAEGDDDNLHVEDDGEDIWASVNAKAKKPKFGEVADAPPKLTQLKKLSSVPKSAGSLARRQILEAERERVIAHYRQLRGTDAGPPPLSEIEAEFDE